MTKQQAFWEAYRVSVFDFQRDPNEDNLRRAKVNFDHFWSAFLNDDSTEITRH